MTEDHARLSEEVANVNDNMNAEERDILEPIRAGRAAPPLQAPNAKSRRLAGPLAIHSTRPSE